MAYKCFCLKQYKAIPFWNNKYCNVQQIKYIKLRVLMHYSHNNVFLICFQAVAAFAVSAVASQWERTGKPFNPLLGETYELTR